MTTTESKTDRIRSLNDAFRRTFVDAEHHEPLSESIFEAHC